MSHQYRPNVFDVTDEKAAREIILTPAGGQSTDQRWEIETPYVANRVAELLDLDARDTIIDFGCGIGRISKVLIENTGCSVLGVDISASMRELAVGYVGSERFRAVSPEELDRMAQGGWRADGAFACWVLQHCPQPEAEIVRIVGALHPASDLVVFNLATTQAIPVDVGWSLQEVDMRTLLRRHAAEIMTEGVPPEINPEPVFAGLYLTHQSAQAQPEGDSGGLWSRLKRLLP